MKGSKQQRGTWFSVLGAALVLAATSSAQAYVLKTHEGHLVRWHQDTFELHVEAKSNGQLRGVSLNRATRSALAAWQALGELPQVEIVTDGRGLPAGYDPAARENFNTVKVLDEWPFDSENLAVTVASMSPEGEILDADIFVNAQHHVFTDQDHGYASEADFDLQSVLTHELGHLFGLADSPDVPEATMWPYTQAGDTKARTLADDDRAGIAELYADAVNVLDGSTASPDAPALGTPVSTPIPASASAAGCAAHGGGRAAGWMLLLFACLLWRAVAPVGRRALWLLPAALVVGCAAQGPELDAQTSDAEPGAVQDGWYDGHVVARETERRAGLLFTRLVIADDQGRELTAEVAGGKLDGITQLSFHQAVPSEGERIIAEVRKGKLRGFRTSDDRPVAGRALKLLSRSAPEE